MAIEKLDYKVQITTLLVKLQTEAAKMNPDAKHNSGRLIGEAYFWDTVEALAKKQSATTWEGLEALGITLSRDEEPGNYDVDSSPSFDVTCKISNPRQKFDEEKLAKALQRKYKIPIPVTKEMVANAKVDGSKTMTWRITEK